MTKTLGQIFNDCGSDKESGHAYGELYERHLPVKVNKLCEIGTWHGGGIIAFKEYYKDEGEFYALDRFLVGHRLITEGELATKGINSLKGDQDDILFLAAIKERFTVISEDASHHWKAQITTFARLFVHNLEWGGLYVCEDVFDEEYWGQQIIKSCEENIIGLFKKVLNGGTLVGQMISQSESDIILSMIGEVHIYENIIFITKK